MNRRTRTAAATIALALIASLAFAPDPAVGSTRAAPTSVIVVLKTQADVSAISAGTRKHQLSAIERALRTTAESAQAPILDLLARRQRQGKVATYTSLWIYDAIAVTAVPDVISELATRPEVARVEPDLSLPAPTSTAATLADAASPASNVARIDAPAMWDLGFRGQGIVVANMDTGVDASHPELASRWRGGSNSWYDPYGQHPTTPTDVNGHGTWTMGVMVGGGQSGTAIGVAPDARWIAVKIFNDQGVATSSAIHQGFQWLLDPDGDVSTADAPNVVNDSWTMSTSGCALDFQPDLRNLRAAGILPIFAAGNNGPAAGTDASPSNNPEAFAVGATDANDAIWPSSSRGPSACDGSVYPAITAPGVDIETTDLYGSYVDVSGTSVAAPAAAGALALLLDAVPGASADRQAAALRAGAVDLGPQGPDDAYGAGRLDVLASFDWLRAAPDFSLSVAPASVTVSPGSSAEYTVTGTATNGFSADVTLSASGLPAGASGAFDPAALTGGTGASTLTVTTTSSLVPGAYPFTISGTDGEQTKNVSATLVVPAPPDFALSATPASTSVVAGSQATFSTGVTSMNGFTSDVTLSVTGLPASVGTGTFSPAVVAGGAGTSQLTITTPASAPAGTYPLTFVGTGGGAIHTLPLLLTVTAPPPDFSLSVAPTSRSIARGRSATFSIKPTGLFGFKGSVSLSVTGLPNGTTATFKPNPVKLSTTSTMTVKTTSRTPRGTYTLTIAGTAGSLRRTSGVTLTVT